MESDHLIVGELVQQFSKTAECIPFYAFVGPLTIGLLGVCSYRLYKYIVIKQNIEREIQRIKSSKELSEAKIRGELENAGHLEKFSSMSWKDLLEGLRSGEVSAVQALQSYQSLALELDANINCITGWIDDAIERARYLDTLSSSERGPLHGIPFSVKECYDISGMDSTAGMIKFAGNPATQDCPAVALLKKLGGVPFCKTNIPQTMYSMQCSNPIFGTTQNPHKAGREAGGSSGGEGAIIGGGASIIGIGSDIGGSLRNPAAFCGIYSLKPTHGRHLTQVGVVSPSGTEPVGIPVVGGYMSSSAKALRDCWKITWDLEDSPNNADCNLVPMPWNEKLFSFRPKIGYFCQFDMLQPEPGAQRAVREAVQLLEKQGYEVVECDSPPMLEVIRLYVGIVMADKNVALYQNMSWDRYDSGLIGVTTTTNLLNLPTLIQKWLVHPILASLTRIPPCKKIFSKTADLWQELAQRDSLKQAYLESMKSLGIDIILAPAQMLPAPPTGVMGLFVAGIIPYIPWNLFNFPAGIAPITHYNEQDLKDMGSFPMDDLAYRMMKGYCDEGAVGLPLAVQVVGKPNMDEQVLKILTEFENIQS